MSKLDKAADAVRRASLSKHYPAKVIAPWERVPEDVRDQVKGR